jgi:hypothetical protein
MIPIYSQNIRKSWLNVAQWLLLGVIVVLSIHTHRWAILQIDLPLVFVGFRAALLFVFDLPLIVLLFIFVLRLTDNPQYGEWVSDTLNEIISLRYGGVWLLLLIVWIALSGFWAGESALARYGAIQTILLFAMSIVLAQTIRQGDDEPVLWIFSLGAVGQSIIAIAQWLQGDAIGLGWLGELHWDPNDLFGYKEEIFRGYGLTAHPNMLAGYLVVASFAVVTLLYRQRVFSVRWVIAVFFLGGIIGGLLATLSRTGLFAGLLAVAAMVAFRWRSLRQIPRQYGLVLGGLLLIGLVLVVLVFGGTLLERNWGLQDSKGVGNRLTLGYDDTLDVIGEHPIRGSGEGNLMIRVGRNHLIPTGRALLPAHNVFLVVLAELGIPGLILFLLACVTVLRRLFGPLQGPAFVWTVAFLAWVAIMPFDYYPWLDYRTRLLTFWIVGMWWGYLLRSDKAHLPQRSIPINS